jgi:hypothetical protein
VEEEANSLALVRYVALGIEQKIQEDNLWEDTLQDDKPHEEDIQLTSQEQVEAQDLLEEVRLGHEDNPNPVLINKQLEPSVKAKLIALLKANKECFAWSYKELPGLDRELVEHRLPIKPQFKPVKQPTRRMSPETIAGVKKEIQRLLDAGFIRTARYVEWLSNVVPVPKKNGSIIICVDF